MLAATPRLRNARMLKKIATIPFAALTLALGMPSSHGATAQAEQIYQQHCAICHGEQRIGSTGPALLPESLSRIKKAEAIRVISEGRPATQMVGYQSVLTEEVINQLVDYLYTPAQQPPTWSLADIRASHRLFVDPSSLPDTPQHLSDPMNLFVVVEAGASQVWILDGDNFEPVDRFQSHFALHGGPKFSPDGRFVYFASRDGWVSMYDLHNLRMISETRVALNTRNLAVSNDGKWVMVGNYLPASLVVLDAQDLSFVKEIPVVGQDGVQSRVSAVYTAPPRNSFVVALKDTQEVWEFPHLDNPSFEPRRILASDYLDDFSFTPDYRYLLATSRQAKGGQVIDMQTGQSINNIPLPGMPHLGSGIYWKRGDQWVFATPNISQGLISVLDMATWELIEEIPTKGPGFFMRSHENSRYAWTDVFFGPNNEFVHLIDKDSLKIAHTLRPAPGKNAAHVEFDKDGSHLILSVWDDEGELIIIEADTLNEVKRIPMKKPSGKYNVYNKINFAEGTSH